MFVKQYIIAQLYELSDVWIDLVKKNSRCLNNQRHNQRTGGHKRVMSLDLTARKQQKLLQVEQLKALQCAT